MLAALLSSSAGYALVATKGVVAAVTLIYGVFTACGLCFPVAVTRWWIRNVPGASWQQGDISRAQWQRAHNQAPAWKTLPAAGELVTSDFRPSAASASASASAAMDRGGELRLVCWNIFSGQNLAGCIAELKKMSPPPDVVLLQEDNMYMDITCDDRQTPVYRHAGGAIAEALGMKVVFTPAYFRPGGCYGMSILS